MKERNGYIDFLKGIAIFTVVWGHCIQYLNGPGTDFMSDPVFKFIYIFHMPLFMFLSGYVSVGAMSRKLSVLIPQKTRQLVLPTLLLSLAVAAVNAGLTLAEGGHPRLSSLYVYVMGYWYIWALLYCMAAVRLTLIAFRSDWALAAALAVSLLLPDVLDLNMFKFMFPFFIAGYLTAKYRPAFGKWIHAGGLASTALFALCYVLWKKEYFVYGVPTFVLAGGGIDPDNLLRIMTGYAFRTAGGFAGIGMIAYFGYMAYSKIRFSRITETGRMTFGIYLFQTALFLSLRGRVSLGIDNPVVYGLVCPVAAMLITWIIVLCIGMVDKSAMLSALLLGKYDKKLIPHD